MASRTDQYVWAVTRSLPQSQRAAVASELRASIAASVAAKTAAGVDEDAAETAALTELGDPDRRAAEHLGRPGYLIGPRYYYQWRRLVILLMSIVAPSVLGAMTLSLLLAGEHPLAAFGTALSTAFTVTVYVAFWTTVVFAIIDHSPKDRLADVPQWEVSDLPEVPSSRISLGETVGAVIANLVIIGLFVVQDNVWVVESLGSEPIAVLNPELWSFWLPYFIAIAVLEIIFAVVAYAIGHWTWLLAGVNIVLNLAFAIPAIWLLATGQVFNPPFVAQFSEVEELVRIVLVVIPFAIGLVAVLDTAEGIRKAWRAGRVPEAS